MIVLFLKKKQHRVPLDPVEGPCGHCGGPSVFAVTRSYTTTHLYGFPCLTSRVETTYQCRRCQAVSVGAAPAGAPNLPFFHRFSTLLFLSPIAIGLIVFAGYLVHLGRVGDRHERSLAMVQPVALRASALEDRIGHWPGGKADEEIKRCNEQLNRNFDMTSTRAPSAVARLRGARVVWDSYGDPPVGAYFGARFECKYSPVPTSASDWSRSRQSNDAFRAWAGAAAEKDVKERVERESRAMDAVEAALPDTGKIQLPPVVVVFQKFVAKEAKRPADVVPGVRAVWLDTTNGAVLAVAAASGSNAYAKVVAQAEQWQ